MGESKYRFKWKCPRCGSGGASNSYMLTRGMLIAHVRRYGDKNLTRHVKAYSGKYIKDYVKG